MLGVLRYKLRSVIERLDLKVRLQFAHIREKVGDVAEIAPDFSMALARQPVFLHVLEETIAVDRVVLRLDAREAEHPGSAVLVTFYRTDDRSRRSGLLGHRLRQYGNLQPERVRPGYGAL